jgi:hypothetical protein
MHCSFCSDLRLVTKVEYEPQLPDLFVPTHITPQTFKIRTVKIPCPVCACAFAHRPKPLFPMRAARGVN